ncbi:hypothetical protein IWW50_005412, partial [Coemansia erecta]
KLKGEEAQVGVLQTQVGEANKRLSVVAAQNSQLDQDVHHVQTQQVALNQRLQQAQEDERQLNAEIAALEQQKSHLEQTLAAAQSQIRQHQQLNQELAEKAAALKTDTSTLAQKVAEAEATAKALAAESQSLTAKTQMQIQTQSTARESLSFDDIFGTGGDSQPLTAEGAAFSSSSASGEFISARTEDGRSGSLPHYPASSGSVASMSESLPAPMPHSHTTPASVFANMPSLGSAIAGSSASAASTDAFDSFGAHSSDPFEEFLQSAGAPKEKSASEDQSFDALFAPAVGRSHTKSVESAARAASDPRSVTSTPAPSNRATPAIGHGTTKSTPSSPPLNRAASATDGKASGLSAASGQGFAADFSAAFGTMPTTTVRAINQDIEAFESKFPDIGSLAVSDAAAKPAEDGEDLTFESVFGSGDDLPEPQANAAKEKPAPVSAPASAREAPASDAKDSESKTETTTTTTDKSSVSEDDFVPPPVVKRTNVSARPMSRVLSIFRSSSSGPNIRGGASQLKRSAAEKRQQLLKEQDKKFEEKWAKGDWPEWVKKGEYFYERKMLVEMGYPKDRVVEALE